MIAMKQTNQQSTSPENDKLGDAMIIHTIDLFKNYITNAGTFQALKNVNFEIEKGEFVVLLGKSGAGKTTLINLLSSIDSPSSGEIYVDDEAVHSLSENEKARWRGMKIGLVFQFFQLIPNLNLIENITLPMDFTNSFPLHSRKERALELLDMVGIVDHAYKVPAKISGGQQQRVAIARALANDPIIILADEPTGNLDSRTSAEIFDLFGLLVDQGKTLFVVSHDKEIARFADRIIEISDGEIVA